MEEDGRGGAEARCWKGETAEAPESNFVIQSDLHLGRTTSSLSIFIAVERSTNLEMYLGNHVILPGPTEYVKKQSRALKFG